MKAGAAGGTIAGAAGPIVGTIGSRIGDAFAGVAARYAAPVPGVSRPVADMIGRTLANDGALGPAGAANIASAGPYGMLVDASPSLSQTLDTALQRGGPGTAAAQNAITARTAATNAGLTSTLDQSLGAPQGIASTTAGIRDGSAAARQAAYDTAYATPIDYSSPQGRALDDMISNRVPAGIVGRAMNQMRVDGKLPTQQVLASVAPDGSVSYRQMPDVQTVDYITRSLNDVARSGDGQGALGGNTSEGRSFGVLARELRNTLRGAVPEYGSALDTAAQPIQARNALDFGATLLHPSTPTDVAAATIGDMTGPELAQARAGVRAHIADAIGNVRRTAANPDLDNRQAMQTVQMLSSDAAQQKLGMLVGPQEAQGIGSALDQASRSLALQAAVSRNSATYARGMTNAAIDQAAQPGLLARMLTSGGLFKATRAPAELLTGSTPGAISQRGDAIAGELAGLLTGSQGPGATGILDSLIRSQGARDAASSFAGSIPYGQTASTGLLSGLLTAQQRSQ